MLRVVLFYFGSFALLPLSWRSFRHTRAHGFYRFFAFELLLALILLNAPIWFHNPFSIGQWALYGFGAVSIVLALEGFRLLRQVGKPAPVSVLSTNLAFENTSQLVITGAYRWIRHPLYASLMALGVCAYLKNPLNLWSVLMMFGVGASLLLTAMAEERENMDRFGRAYGDYMRSTKRFVPFLF